MSSNNISFLQCSQLQQHSPKKNIIRAIIKSPKFLISTIFILGFIFMLEIRVSFDPKSVHQFLDTPCFIPPQEHISKNPSSSFPVTPSFTFSQENASAATSPAPLQLPAPPSLIFPQKIASTSLPPSSGLMSNISGDKNNIGLKDDGRFWEQPKGGRRYRPCLGMSEGYKNESGGIVGEKRNYLMVMVNGGLNQQRNQVVDAVVVARILGAVLVAPIFEPNSIWADESEFSDVFDLEHFKSVLENDVRVVSNLPSTHITQMPVVKTPALRMPLHLIRATYLPLYKSYPILMLRGFDSCVATKLPYDLQKLRCKVAFHALKFAPRILELGNKLTERMRRRGPYLSLHLRMEKDVWVRTGCLPGLGRQYNEMIKNERKARPDLLTSRSNMTYRDRKLAGLCPLNALDVTRLLKALGAPQSANIYWAGGIPLGGKEALQPLIKEFPYFYNKEDLALPGELEPFASKASLMAALDYIVCENSDVFMASHGGNMGHALQGQRAYAGHKKTIIPNKRQMIKHFMNRSIPEAEFNRIILALHGHSLGQPVLSGRRSGRPVTKYPIPECMCKNATKHSNI